MEVWLQKRGIRVGLICLVMLELEEAGGGEVRGSTATEDLESTVQSSETVEERRKGVSKNV